MLRSLVGSEMCIRDRGKLEQTLAWLGDRTMFSAKQFPLHELENNPDQCTEDTLYMKLAHIGEGSYADVYLATPREPHVFGKKKYVIKELDVMSMEEKDQKKAVLEVNILATLKHPNIIGYKESYLHDGFLCIVMEHADGGDIFHHITHAREEGFYVDESMIISWLAQILLALEYVHSHQLLHRDIKPQNIFLMSNGMVKLGDFGVSRVLEDDMALARTTTGTPCYFSPELCRSEEYDSKSDIWALGCITYEMAALLPPFQSEDMAQMCREICSTEPPPLPAHFSNDLRMLIKMMMEKDPGRRPSAHELLQVSALRKICKRLPWARAQTTACGEGRKSMRGKRITKKPSRVSGRQRVGSLPTLGPGHVMDAMAARPAGLAMPSISETTEEALTGRPQSKKSKKKKKKSKERSAITSNKETTVYAPHCPNRSNPWHECGQFCVDHWPAHPPGHRSAHPDQSSRRGEGHTHQPQEHQDAAAPKFEPQGWEAPQIDEQRKIFKKSIQDIYDMLPSTAEPSDPVSPPDPRLCQETCLSQVEPVKKPPTENKNSQVKKGQSKKKEKDAASSVLLDRLSKVKMNDTKSKTSAHLSGSKYSVLPPLSLA
eukprot:TRINITY_DN13389_c0_g1_i1.p1 TRINITY_DN13389_c0_g1~~TRINITY_DN13389_c0_g1_i1.p1  ORF type:complete len:617 (-),score=156.96 TRINITY_DN13389_c0_g1_i1:279-2084(-)